MFQELYSQSYTRVGVIFASITNFHEFYTELDGNNQGIECIRLLDYITSNFLQSFTSNIITGYSMRLLLTLMSYSETRDSVQWIRSRLWAALTWLLSA